LHIPTVAEAKQRPDNLTQHGETDEAFTFKKTFAAPEAEGKEIPKMHER